TVTDRVLLRPLEYRDSHRLVTAWEHVSMIGDDPVGPNPRHAAEWVKRTQVFSGIAQLRHDVGSIALDSGGTRPVAQVLCEPALLRVLGIEPAMGRTFYDGEGRNAPGGAILTHEGWQALFGGDRGVIGRTVRINDVPREVVGVLPAGFHFPNANMLRAFRPDQQKSGVMEPWIFLPVVFELSEMEWNGNYGNWVLVGRLRPGVSQEQATAQLNAVQAQVWKEMPGGGSGTGSLRASLRPLQATVVSGSRRGIVLLMGAVAALMLLAALNLANAQLGRALARQHDASLRAALGAARWRLVWSAIAENLLLGLMGCVLGIGLAYAGLELFRRNAPIDLPRMDEVHLDWRVLLFALALTMAAGLVAGLAPGLRLAGGSLARGGARTTASRASQRWRGYLIGVEVCGCTVLLLVAALLAQSLLALLRQDRGFETGQASIAELRLTTKHFLKDESRISLIESALDELRRTPGVQRAAFVSAMPLEGESWIEWIGRAGENNSQRTLVNARWVSPGYFEAIGQRLAAGRLLEERDAGLPVIILSEGAAKALFGNEAAVGHEVDAMGRKVQVIGVVQDSRSTSLKDAPVRMMYQHYRFRPPFQTFFVVKSAGRAEDVLAGMRAALGRQANVTVTRVKTLDRQVTDSVARERFQTLVLISFGASALALAMLGIYGMLSYAVAARRQEIGVRMALGATRAGVYRLAMGQAGWPVTAGLAGGLLLSVAAARLIESFLYGAGGMQAGVMAAVAGVFLLAAGVAAFVPARRAASIDPMEALRAE
ncbi:MAG: ABC transporter permease, partial [Acidobacteria bacterium]|nr:ABC transporter permease [Acidobacteriota bacterium]